MPSRLRGMLLGSLSAAGPPPASPTLMSCRSRLPPAKLVEHFRKWYWLHVRSSRRALGLSVSLHGDDP
ncbi:hypothetical protein BV20DRAFT_974790 [Pilatotrama ljubarskyi]|nr:hypothetical protein BV20DRAFT_974790 [Pilatotrama ljubarskyi]